MAREKDEEALLDFITKSFVFNESDTEQELEEAELAVEEDKEGLDIEEEEEEDEEDGKEFVAKVGDTLFYRLPYWWWDLHVLAQKYNSSLNLKPLSYIFRTQMMFHTHVTTSS